ncbi:hypothetical protein C9413_27505 [Rhizobium sp. SEMIA 4085]|uniref:Uncharacterized protein n=1 Tax=Rhizobium gallicum bv. gallicum R602sp TaxID=1041138 RepID=A0A0B4XB81_9HYPH|nr:MULTISPECIES: hypothetical protein [Rhizobium]AJD43863.1 hypothetical protein RGR602_PB00329 [Rhizobium gallicum bv. gallicum R602sp]NNH33042.1 hypothetical protein [Rhizobium sp. SEMIA 4085]TDW16926.1 hypothetical protein EV128_13166 [Rhizobium azibense]
MSIARSLAAQPRIGGAALLIHDAHLDGISVYADQGLDAIRDVDGEGSPRGYAAAAFAPMSCSTIRLNGRFKGICLCTTAA